MLFLYNLAAVIAQYMKVTWHTSDSASRTQHGGIVSFKNEQQLSDEAMVVRVYAGSHQIYIFTSFYHH